MRRRTIQAVGLLVGVILLGSAWGDVPVNISIQGRLTDDVGEPLPAGVKGCTFAIFDAETDGIKVWPSSGTESHLVYTGEDGLWQATLGSVVALPYAVFADTSRWLEVTMDDGVNPPEVFSRIKLTSLPFAYRAYDASEATHADSASAVADLAVTEGKLGDLAVGNTKIAAAAVSADKIQSDAVTNPKLAPNAVTSDKVQNGTLELADLGPNGAVAGDVAMWNGSAWVAHDPIPAGVIVMWSGNLATVPNGWALCDGNDGRPDLRDRFIYGWSDGVEPGGVGGTATHKHLMGYPSDTRWAQSTIPGIGVNLAYYVHTHDIASSVHLPPYYKLAFIIKL